MKKTPALVAVLFLLLSCGLMGLVGPLAGWLAGQ